MRLVYSVVLLLENSWAFHYIKRVLYLATNFVSGYKTQKGTSTLRHINLNHNGLILNANPHYLILK